jgi:hypothetical protein
LASELENLAILNKKMRSSKCLWLGEVNYFSEKKSYCPLDGGKVDYDGDIATIFQSQAAFKPITRGTSLKHYI